MGFFLSPEGLNLDFFTVFRSVTEQQILDSREVHNGPGFYPSFSEILI